MDSKSFNHFNRFIAAEYPQLRARLTDQDALHDAYLIVADLPQIIPADYLPLLDRAYQVSLSLYKQYIFRFIVPDPRFWLYQNEEDGFTLGELAEQEQLKQQQENENRMKALAFLKWLCTHSTEAEYIIFRMYYYEYLELCDIARITGKTKQEVLDLINRKCAQYRAARERKPAPSDMPKEHSHPRLHCRTFPASILFRRTKQGHSQIIFSKLAVERLGLHISQKINVERCGDAFTVCLTESAAGLLMPYTLTIHQGSRPENQQANNRFLLSDIFSLTGAKQSVTLPLKPTAQPSRWVIDINNPLEIN